MTGNPRNITRAALDAVAEGVRASYAVALDPDRPRPELLPGMDEMVNQLAYVFANHNYDFDWARFAEACGLYYDEDRGIVRDEPAGHRRPRRPAQGGHNPEPGEVTGAMIWAMTEADNDPGEGRIPDQTAGVVLGSLYLAGLAERATVEHPRRITDAGRRWLIDNHQSAATTNPGWQRMDPQTGERYTAARWPERDTTEET